ncbi:peptide ABC transporter substrate-binding protein [Fusobacterium pseudoperiodonticum]|uniref:Peptide ABC transporter substrate-binding protein n=1 Tax=Fusobacterium pseudoperiodonticum TaxID=2663009 RepID=A0A2D3PCT9_9FUSO|nr:oligopeptide ABC transporter substrate-binding protein [Fusobacterium pseudoperiodonticum]MBF1201049.1 oligopeptide ABC transporter substrate-binding protein [Fusobacterium periodonticum]ATV56607.1 peptide ABC transporter substrate-binding protein [Fusobacterium pseudoperiodonticum]ATV64171.1 peptide ABC transporter substrate-binding protein [Fusobacterium pseudoperiodonticum]ATV65472.1 peptide ABC transporter substrate-binding protein [Fusobacterium pseudoperiodonticum]ATV68833.1 oligopept
MKFKKILALISGVLLLASCGGINDGGAKDAKKEAVDVSTVESQYPSYVENEGTPVEATVLKVAVVSDSPFRGIFNGFLYSDSLDGSFMASTMNGAFPIDPDLKIILDSDETPIKVSVNPEEKTVTYKINPNFKWSNGEPVTTKDIVKTYEIMANQEYITSSKSLRYNKNRKAIVGIEEYNEGKADKISGLEVIDDSTMKIHLKEMTPSVYWGGNFVPEFVNAKQFEGIPMDKITESDALRKNPLSYGPYVIKEIVQGEKVIFEANPYYYKGEPKIKRLEMEILPPSQQVAAIKSGKYDIVLKVSPEIFPELEKLDNINILTKKAGSMNYIAFKLGKWDEEKNEVVTDPNSKMYDLNLRKAIAYAIDMDAVSKQFYHGLSTPAKSQLSPLFPSLHNPEINGFKQDVEKAKQLLDEAGFKDVDGDGIREGKDGKPVKYTLAMMSGGEIAEPLAQYYIQQWKAIGLDVELLDGRLLDSKNFYNRVNGDDPAIDFCIAGIGFGTDPQQLAIFGKNAKFNISRYISDNLEAALDATVSKEAMNEEYRVKAYKDYEKVFMEEIPAVPILNKLDILVVNKRIKKYDWRPNVDGKPNTFKWSMIEVVAPQPIVDSKN